MQGLLTTPTLVMYLILGFIGVIVGVTFIISRVRRSDMDILRNTNTDLRAQADDNGKRITNLESQIKTLQGQVLSLEKHNKTLEDLVITALKQYFLENPKMASAMKDIIQPSA